MKERTTVQAPPGAMSLGWLVFVSLACAHFAMVQLWRDPQYLDLELYARGGSPLPFQGRVLMAWVLRASAGSHYWGALLARLAPHFPKEYRDPYVMVLLVTTFAAMFVAVMAARASLILLTGNARFASWAALLTLYMAYFDLIAVYGLTYTLPYDAPALAFFSVGIWLILARRYWVFAGLFAIATLNRETSCFLTIFMVLYVWFGVRNADAEQREHAVRRVLPQVVLQAAVWICIRLWVHHHFLHNPRDPHTANSVFTFQLVQNLRSMIKPAQWPLFLSLFGFTVPLFFYGYRWMANRALASSVAVLSVLWVGAMLMVGGILEIRIFNELSAFMVVALGAMLWDRWVSPANSWRNMRRND